MHWMEKFSKTEKKQNKTRKCEVNNKKNKCQSCLVTTFMKGNSE